MLTILQWICHVSPALDEAASAYAHVRGQVLALGHVMDQIALFLLDLYAMPLDFAVRHDAIRLNPNQNQSHSHALLRFVLFDESYGRHFDGYQVYDAMCVAARENQLVRLQMLFEYVANADMRLMDFYVEDMDPEATDWHPIPCAAQHGHVEIVQWLLIRKDHTGRDEDDEDEEQYMARLAILQAARHGHRPVVSFLYEHRPHSISNQVQQVAEGAIAGNHRAIVEYLDSQGLTVCTDCLKKTAIMNGHLSTAEWLDEQIKKKKKKHGVDQKGRRSKRFKREEPEQVQDNSSCAHHQHHCGVAQTLSSVFWGFKWEKVRAVGTGKCLQVINWYRARHPSVQVDSQMLAAASQGGDLETVQWVIKKLQASGKHDKYAFERAVYYACQCGHLKIVSLLLQSGYRPSVYSLHECVSKGHVEVLRALLSQDPDEKEWVVERHSLEEAAINGHIDVLCMVLRHTSRFNVTDDRMKLLKRLAFESDSLYGEEWDQVNDMFPFGFAGVVRDMVREEDFWLEEMLPLVESFRNRPSDYSPTKDFRTPELISFSLMKSHQEEELWHQAWQSAISSKRFDEKQDNITLGEDDVEVGKHLGLILDKLNRRWDEAAEVPYSEMKWTIGHFGGLSLVLNRANCSPDRVDYYIYTRDIARIKHLLDNQVRIPSSVMDLAAKVGSLSMVQLLHERCEDSFTKDAMDFAAGGGFLHVVKFLHHNRKEGCTDEAMNQAATNGHLKVVQFLHEHRTEGCSLDAFFGAAFNGHLEVLRFLYDKGYDDEHVENASVWWKAMEGQQLAVLRWLVATGRQGELEASWIALDEDHYNTFYRQRHQRVVLFIQRRLSAAGKPIPFYGFIP